MIRDQAVREGVMVCSKRWLWILGLTVLGCAGTEPAATAEAGEETVSLEEFVDLLQEEGLFVVRSGRAGRRASVLGTRLRIGRADVVDVYVFPTRAQAEAEARTLAGAAGAFSDVFQGGNIVAVHVVVDSSSVNAALQRLLGFW